MSGNTCSSTEIYATGSLIESERYSGVDCLLYGLQDNSDNLITAKNVRDAVFTLWERISDLEPSGVLFENPDPVPFGLGGIAAGATFSQTNMQDMWDRLLYDQFPDIGSPSFEISSSYEGLVELNSNSIDIEISVTFNRGSINPQYQSDEPFSSGLPIQYEYIGYGGLSQSISSNSLNDSFTIGNHQVVMGTQSWSCRVLYDVGVQPKTKLGYNYLTALPSGYTLYKVVSINGTLPIFATSENITELKRQDLKSPYDEYYELELVPDSEDNSNKQTFQYPTSFEDITGIQQLNTITNTWDWISGDKNNSLTYFNTDPNIQKDINGILTNYIEYVYNGPKIGFRKIRLYTN